MQIVADPTNTASAATTGEPILATEIPTDPSRAIAHLRIVGSPLPEPSAYTLALYAADWAGFTRWCREHHHACLPADAKTVADYLLAAAATLSRGTLGRRRAAIITTHRRAGLPIPLLTTETHRALRAAVGPNRASRIAPSPSPAILVRAAGRIPRDLVGLRDRALLLVATLCGGRRARLGGDAPVPRHAVLRLNAEHVRFTPTGVVLTLLPKDDGFASAVPTAMTRGADAATCPVRALEDWLRSSDASFGPVFRKVDRWGNVEHGRLAPDAWQRILRRRVPGFHSVSRAKVEAPPA